MQGRLRTTALKAQLLLCPVEFSQTGGSDEQQVLMLTLASRGQEKQEPPRCHGTVIHTITTSGTATIITVTTIITVITTIISITITITTVITVMSTSTSNCHTEPSWQTDTGHFISKPPFLRQGHWWTLS